MDSYIKEPYKIVDHHCRITCWCVIKGKVFRLVVLHHIKCMSHMTLQFTISLPDFLNKLNDKHVVHVR